MPEERKPTACVDGGLLMRRKALPEGGRAFVLFVGQACDWSGLVMPGLYVEACCVLLPLPAVFR